MLYDKGSSPDSIRLSDGQQLSSNVVVLQIAIRIPMSNSLKDKRNILKRIKSSLRKKYNVSVSEIGDQDVYRRGALAAAMVTEAGNSLDGVMEKILDDLWSFPEIEVIESRIEFL